MIARSYVTRAQLQSPVSVPLNLTRFSNSSDTSRSRAAALQAVFTGATTSAIGWIDPTSAVPDDVLQAMCDRLEEPGIAAVTLSGCGRTLTSLGVPASRGARPSESSPNETVRRVLYAPAGLAVFHRQRVLSPPADRLATYPVEPCRPPA